MNTATPQTLREAWLLASNDNGDDIYQGDLFRSNDTRDNRRPLYMSVGVEEDRIILAARPSLTPWPVKDRFAEETRVNVNRFFKTTQKGWSLYA